MERHHLGVTRNALRENRLVIFGLCSIGLRRHGPFISCHIFLPLCFALSGTHLGSSFVVYRGFGSGGCWWLIAGMPNLAVVLTCKNISKVVNMNQPLADSIRLHSAWGLRKMARLEPHASKCKRRLCFLWLLVPWTLGISHGRKSVAS